MAGEFGPSFTSSGLRISPTATLDDGVTFCIRGVLVHADEAVVISSDAERISTLRGTVTVAMPQR